MIDLVRVVNKVRDDLKGAYLSNQGAVWQQPFVCFINNSGANFLEGANSDEAIVAWLLANRNGSAIRGIVVGRMVAKYSKTIKDVQGNPQILEKGIMISGRLFSPEQTYVTITPCREHNDLRDALGDTPENAEPVGEIPGFESSDKVEKVVSAGGHVQFKSMKFGREIVYDSRKGQRCALDPIIEGVIDTPDAPAGGLAGIVQ